MNDTTIEQNNHFYDVAVIGMAGRFPGAHDLDTFWRNLSGGVESISFFTDQELVASGIPPTALQDPHYIKAKGIIDDVDLFDAVFFGYSPREAEVIEPQQRLFLECAWEALENAGCDPKRFPGAISVYAGSNMNHYLLINLLSHLTQSHDLDRAQVLHGNSADFLATRVAYKLNLRGAAVTVQTACSTSLVAVHMAYQSLLSHECDMALAGGISIGLPHKSGYIYQEGGIASPDGHCQAFDAKSKGTLRGDGLGIVVLKRLDDALRDGNTIHAVIKGSAINNDGAEKIGFTAPSINGQANAIADALAMANIDPATITYVETHGTGTQLGDPIEIAALNQAFARQQTEVGTCAIGSVKTNIGHLDAAAGAAGFIKTVLALKHRMLPPSLHFQEPNPQIDFAHSPFFVNTKLTPWLTDQLPLRAGVSSFGIGGTNAHIILEEAPILKADTASRSWQILLLSGKTPAALEQISSNLIDHLKLHSEQTLADIAYTLQTGRQVMKCRRMVLCQDRTNAILALDSGDTQYAFTATPTIGTPEVVFLFPGQGVQYVNMARGLYEEEATFRYWIDLSCDLLIPYLGEDLRKVLYPLNQQDSDDATEALKQTRLTQPALFVIEYALAQLWLSWGIKPYALLGHSVGEYVAACLAKVITLEDALLLVTARGRLIQQLPHGAMLAVHLSPDRLRPLIEEMSLDLAAINAPDQCVVSGPIDAIEAFAFNLELQKIDHHRLHTSHAFHSAMMEPMLAEFAQRLQEISFAPPQLRYLSNVTGTWITEHEATDPDYWVRHLRQTVRFSDCLLAISNLQDSVFLEVGPGHSLSTLVKQHSMGQRQINAISSVRSAREQLPDLAHLLRALGQLWQAGIDIQWTAFYRDEQRQLVPLPTYPFERQRFWVDPLPLQAIDTRDYAKGKKVDQADWFYLPSWKKTALPNVEPIISQECWLLFCDDYGIGTMLAKKLTGDNEAVILVEVGERFEQVTQTHYRICPDSKDDYDTLFSSMQSNGQSPQQIVHLWGIGPKQLAEHQREMQRTFYSLLWLTQALNTSYNSVPVRITFITNNTQSITDEASLVPERATASGLCKVIPQEYIHLSCRSIDIELPTEQNRQRLLHALHQEVCSNSSDVAVAYRSQIRWTQSFEPIRLTLNTEITSLLKAGGVYLITGGLGRMGLSLATYLFAHYRARLVLIYHSPLPPREDWLNWLATHHEQEKISQQLRTILILEEQGAELLLLQADSSKLVEMQAALSQAEQRFGRINGIIHAAGVAGTQAFRLIERTDIDVCELIFLPKVQGLRVLAELFQGYPLDFCMLQSSLAAILGGLGFAAYAAANAYMDAFAQQRNATDSFPWISVNWDGWQFGGETEQQNGFGAATRELALTSDEGSDALARILAANISAQVLVSTGDLQARLAQWVYQKSEVSIIDREQTQERATMLHPRPNLAYIPIAPRNDIEQTIAMIWQELFGIDQIGVFDNFYDLGGHSLLAIKLAARIRSTFHLEMSMSKVLETSTIAHLAEIVEELLIEKLESLPDEEAQQLYQSVFGHE